MGVEDIPKWMAILLSTISLFTGLGGAWALFRYKVNENKKNIKELKDDIEKHKTDQGEKIISIEKSISVIQTDIGWIREKLQNGLVNSENISK